MLTRGLVTSKSMLRLTAQGAPGLPQRPASAGILTLIGVSYWLDSHLYWSVELGSSIMRRRRRRLPA